jgi:hypothetical protein
MAIVNEDLWIKRTEQKSFLVYLVSDCEMGSEGWSGWMYYAVCHGDTEEELYADWVEQCKKTYTVLIYPKILSITQVLTKMEANMIIGRAIIDWQKANFPDSVYGHSRPLVIEKCFTKHDD